VIGLHHAFQPGVVLLVYSCFPPFHTKDPLLLVRKAPSLQKFACIKNSGIAICGFGMIYFGSKSYLMSHSGSGSRPGILPLIVTGPRKVKKCLLSLLKRAKIVFLSFYDELDHFQAQNCLKCMYKDQVPDPDKEFQIPTDPDLDRDPHHWIVTGS